MTNVIGKVINIVHVAGPQEQLAIAKKYHRNPSNPTFPFGKEVTLIVVKDYEDWILSRSGERYWGQKSSGAGYRGIILGPKFKPDGSVDESVVGIGTGNEVLDFQIDPKAEEIEGHGTLIFGHGNDFAEITGKWNQNKLSS